jgi:ParB family chromosome partitioning protein
VPNQKKSTKKSTKKPTGLGRGFGVLIPEDFDNSLLTEEKERVQKLLISTIAPNPDQPRHHFDDTILQELASSIKRHGILQPIVVRLAGQDSYSIVAGERRWRAAKLAGLNHVPAIIRSLEELEELEIALVENVQRVDLSPMEQAISIQRLHDQFSLAYDQIAKRLGKAPATISNTVRLIQLPPAAQEALRDGLISEGHARAILALKGLDQKQAELLDFIVKNKWTVRQAEQFVVATKRGAPSVDAKKQLHVTTPATQKLSQNLGAPVSIRRSAKGGKLEIAFKTNSDLDKLLKLLSQIG